MELAKYCALRPYLYHLTAESNLEHIRATGYLYPASYFYERAGRTDEARMRRQEQETLRIDADGIVITLRDQKPLAEGHCALTGGWCFEDLVEHLNRHVFFWPGMKGNRVVPKGLSYTKRYYKAEPTAVVIQVRTEDLFTSNSKHGPLFSAYNSGAARSHPVHGKSPRGPDLFQTADEFERTPGEVVECAYASPVRLPTPFVITSVLDFVSPTTRS